MDKQPKILAQFVLDNEGKPKFVEGKRLRHYQIELSVDDVPKNVESVTIELHPTYRNPVREVFRQDAQSPFIENITSYGTFDVSIAASGIATSSSLVGPEETRRDLYEALEDSASNMQGDRDAIQEALRDIREH